MKAILILPLGLALTACGASTPHLASYVPPVTAPANYANAGGIERVMGNNARGLVAMFGKPDADVREGAAQKLQFEGPFCVLDAYLYARDSGEPVVTYLDTRQRDGSAIDRASCVSALTRRSGGR